MNQHSSFLNPDQIFWNIREATLYLRRNKNAPVFPKRLARLRKYRRFHFMSPHPQSSLKSIKSLSIEQHES